MTLSEIGNLVNAGGVVLLLIGALYGGWRQWWVFGVTYREAVKDRDEWKALAMRGLSAADKATNVANAVVTPGPLGEP